MIDTQRSALDFGFMNVASRSDPLTLLMLTAIFTSSNQFICHITQFQRDKNASDIDW